MPNKGPAMITTISQKFVDWLEQEGKVDAFNAMRELQAEYNKAGGGADHYTSMKVEDLTRLLKKARERVSKLEKALAAKA